MNNYTKKDLIIKLKSLGIKGFSKLNKKELYEIYIENKNIYYDYNFKKDIIKLLKIYNNKDSNSNIIHSDISNSSLKYLNEILNIFIFKNYIKEYKYKIKTEYLNQLNFLSFYKNIKNNNLDKMKEIFKWLFEFLWDIFELTNVDSLFIQNNEKGILGKKNDIISVNDIKNAFKIIKDEYYI